MSHTLTGLTNGLTYEISIVGTSDHFFSDSVSADMSVSLGEYPVFYTMCRRNVFLQFLVNQLLFLDQQQPLPSPSPGVFPVTLW